METYVIFRFILVIGKDYLLILSKAKQATAWGLMYKSTCWYLVLLRNRQKFFIHRSFYFPLLNYTTLLLYTWRIYPYPTEARSNTRNIHQVLSSSNKNKNGKEWTLDTKPHYYFARREYPVSSPLSASIWFPPPPATPEGPSKVGRSKEIHAAAPCVMRMRCSLFTFVRGINRLNWFITRWQKA